MNYFINVLFHAMGEYDHKAYHPVADFFSGLLDITIIKPVIECITGTNLITGEKLTDAEMTMKLAGAVVDAFPRAMSQADA